MIREPFEAIVNDDGTVEIPLGVLAEAGLDIGARILVYSDGDGYVVLRRQEDAIQEILERGHL